MSKRTVSGITLTLLLIGMLTLAFNAQPVKASGTIYIMADGSVEPSTANITSVDNITYTFTGNVYDQVVVERDNVIVDGAGYTLQGTGRETGIDLSGRSNVTIKNMEISAFFIGIRLSGSSNNTISRNNMADQYAGIWLFRSSNNIISRNNITNSVHGFDLDSSSDNSILGNNIANNDLGIWFGVSSYNSIYHNSFVNNIDQIYDIVSWGFGLPPSVNVWDNGYPSGGNYWSDYVGTDFHSGPYQNETGHDGIGDTSYIIYADNRDNYPLMKAWEWPVLGDINYDFKVDTKDLDSAARAFGTEPGDDRWNHHADVNGPEYLVPDNKVDMRDIALIARNFGKTHE